MKDIKDIENTIICGDCLEIMRDMQDNSVDLVLTDPPYNVGIDYDTASDNFSVDEYDSKIKALKSAINCEHWGILLGSKTETLLTWWKNFDNAKQIIIRVGANVNTVLGGFRPQYRSVLVTKKSLKWWSDLWEDVRFPGEGYFFNEPRYNHPCHAPLRLMEKLIECLSVPGDLIFDPFCGSGTTCVAAKRLGRRYIGIDISPEYCEIARKRLEAEEKGITVKELDKGQKSLFEGN
jgi:site-specific DNA-methyltransferase (adenine-specific)